MIIRAPLTSLKAAALAVATAYFVGCANQAEPTDDFVKAMGAVSEATQTIEDGGYVSPAWVSQDFIGTHIRDLNGNILTFTIVNHAKDKGGWDGGVALPEVVYGGVPVSEVGDGAVVCSAYAVEMSVSEGAEAKWWAGPKVSVNWAAMEADDNPGDWYENYIIETGSESPDAWERGMRSWADMELVAEAVHDGSAYKHYKVRFHEWWQFWAIRQDQRASGRVAIKPILDVWREHGLPEGFEVDGVKANIETYGPMSAHGMMQVAFNTGGLTAAEGQCEVPEFVTQ
ncbi:MAG: hypothetical protein AAGJ85_04220 [Pseudomonadota bacterium]